MDLARFAVETLRLTTPAARPVYRMIEFDRAIIGGNNRRTLEMQASRIGREKGGDE